MAANQLEMKPASFWNFVSFRIPAQWECIREPGGHWGCYEEDNDTGTVWVNKDIYRFPDENAAAEALERCAATIERRPDCGGIPSTITELEISSSHKVVHHTYAAECEGEILYFSWWSHYLCHGIYVVTVHLNLVLTAEALSDRWISRLAEAVDRELMNATIRPEITVADEP